MKAVEEIRRHIIESFFNKPILGENYIDWHTEDGECGLTLMFKNANEQFDIIIRGRKSEEFKSDRMVRTKDEMIVALQDKNKELTKQLDRAYEIIGTLI